MKHITLAVVCLFAIQAVFANGDFCKSLEEVIKIAQKNDATLLGEKLTTWNGTTDYNFPYLLEGASNSIARLNENGVTIFQYFGKQDSYDNLIDLFNQTNASLANCGIELSQDRWGVLRADQGGVIYSLELMELFYDEETEATMYRVSMQLTVRE